jgi:hypothetical protein
MSSSQLTIRHIFQRGRAILDKENMRLWHGMTQAWRNWKSAKSHGNPMEIWKSHEHLEIPTSAEPRHTMQCPVGL